MKNERKTHRFYVNVALLTIVLIIGLALRVQHLWTPLADFHSWRQADTAAVARNYQKHGINLMSPTYDDLSNIQSGQDNPQGYRMVEFPLYNAAITVVSNITGLDIDVSGRIVSLLSSLVVIAIVYILALEEMGEVTAVAAALTYAVFPFFVYFSRVVLPESAALAVTFVGLCLIYYAPRAKSRITDITMHVVAAIMLSAGILIKPTVIFYALAYGFVFIKRYEWTIFKRIQVYVFFVAAVIPFLLWRKYILMFPAGIPVSDWLITSVNTSGGLQSVFFKPAFFRWVFYERINNIIFGGYLTPFFVLGLIRRPKSYVLLSIVASAGVFLFVFQGGNVQHEYYQTIIFPALALGVGMGVSYITDHARQFIHPALLGGVIIAMFGFSFFISYFHVNDYYNYPQDLVTIAGIIKTISKPDDKIITDTIGDTTLLYLADRRGSPAPYKEFDVMKHEGYAYFVTSNHDVIRDKKIENKYKTVFENDKFAIFAL